MKSILDDERFRSLLDAIAEPLLITDGNGRIVAANAPSTVLFGYTGSEIVSLGVEDLVPPRLRAEHRARRQAYSASPRMRPMASGLDIRGLRKDGSEFAAEISLSPLPGDLVLANIHDVSDRLRTAQVLQQSEERFRLLVEQAPDGIFLSDAQGRFVDISPAGCEMLQYSREEIRRMALVDVVAPEDVARITAELAHCSTDVQARCEWNFRRRDGSAFIGEVVCRKLPDGRLQAIVRDITERRRVEEELRESEARFRAVFEQAATGIALLAPDGRLLRANRMLCELLGRNARDLLQRRLQDLSHPDDVAAERRQAQQLLAGEIDTYATETRLLDENGEAIWVKLTASLVRNPDGMPNYSIVVIEDRRTAKRTEAALRELRSNIQELMELHVATETAQAIAHDLNQPLNAVTSYAEAAVRMLESGAPDPQRLLHVIKGSAEQAERAGRVVRELLQFLQKGDAVIEAVDLNAVVANAIAVVESNGYGGFEAEVALDPALRPVRANRLHIEKVMVNLLRNSVEAMRGAGIATRSIRIRVKTDATAGMAHVSVSDSGPGLDAQTAKRIFDPFFTTKPRGIGMGLAICRSLIKSHGGRLWLDIDAKPGATFHFTLPLMP